MKILIIHASAGAGHVKAAEALSHAFKKNCPEGLSVITIDALDYTNAVFKKSYPAVYIFLVKHFPLLWGACFHFLNFSPLMPIITFFRLIFNKFHGRGLIEYILREKPEVIICEHFFSAQLVSYLKTAGKFKGYVLCGITDFGVHRFWINKGTDYYLVASESTKRELLQKGVEQEKILVTGIPIEQRFSRQCSKDQLRDNLGLDKNLFTILVTSGGFGVGPIEKIVYSLDDMNIDLQILVICGKNNQMYDSLKARDFKKKAVVLGYVTNMDECMGAADMIVSKSGGLTVSESLAKGLPMIIIKPIPGQEMRNAEIIEENNIGVRLIDLEEITEKITLFLKDDKKILNEMRKNTKVIAKPDAANRISQWVIKDLLLKT
ncbi:MAG: glycosyltransferase [Candidatus Omnitrophota bacterium]